MLGWGSQFLRREERKSGDELRQELSKKRGPKKNRGNWENLGQEYLKNGGLKTEQPPAGQPVDRWPIGW